MSEYVALVSGEISADEYSALSSEYEVIRLPSDVTVDSPVRSHPDMILCIVGDTLITHTAYYDACKATVDRIAKLSGLRVTTSDIPRGAKYPADVGFNAVVTATHLICNTKTVAPEVLALARDSGLAAVHVNQGYAACSCIVTDDTVITSDASIHNACEKSGIPSHLISNRGIFLPGYDVGFIGGSGGYANRTLYFYGSLRGLECEDEIVRITEKYGYSIQCLGNHPLTDRGGIKFIKLAKR